MLGNALQMPIPLRGRGLGRLARHGRGPRRHIDRCFRIALGHSSENTLLIVRAVGGEGTIPMPPPGPATTHKNIPAIDNDVLPIEVEVTDPTHPLFGRRFRLIAVTKTLALGACARVECRPGTPLVLPLGVTSLSFSPAGERRRTKLTPEALAELVAVAGESEAACPSTPETCGPACGRRSAGRTPEISAPSCRR